MEDNADAPDLISRLSFFAHMVHGSDSEEGKICLAAIKVLNEQRQTIDDLQSRLDNSVDETGLSAIAEIFS